MKTNFEFLGSEPIENVITAMHYKMDKVIFLSYDVQMASQNGSLEAFLKDCCGVKDVVFVPVEMENLAAIKETISKYIENELAQGNEIYFDVTGGQGLILTAFGMLAERYKAPIHFFDIERDSIIEVEEGATQVCSRDVEKNNIHLDLEKYMELMGYFLSQLPKRINIKMEGNIPVFTMTYDGGPHPKTETLTSLFYVLEDKANKFGGKYAKKIFKIQYEVKKASIARAKVMNIEIVRT